MLINEYIVNVIFIDYFIDKIIGILLCIWLNQNLIDRVDKHLINYLINVLIKIVNIH